RSFYSTATPPTPTSTLSLHDALPIFQHSRGTALAAADAVCVIGTPLDFRLGFGRFAADAKLVHIHADPTELGRNRTPDAGIVGEDRKSTRLNSSHRTISYAVFCLKKK